VTGWILKCKLLSGIALVFAIYLLSPQSVALADNSAVAVTNQPPATEPSEAEQISERLKEKGLQEIKRSQVEHLVRDPRYKDGRVLLVDARDEENYKEGHIPGACQLNPYQPEKSLSNVLALCQKAEQVVVYCTGGDCDDSDSTAMLLRDGGVANKKLFVYGGGFAEWELNNLPVKKGDAK
jgi:rhodanese-related sulfurtransferase